MIGPEMFEILLMVEHTLPHIVIHYNTLLLIVIACVPAS